MAPAGAVAEPAAGAGVEGAAVEAGDDADPDDELMTVDAVAPPAAAGAEPPEQAARGAATPRRSAPHSGIAADRRCRLLMCAAFSTVSPDAGRARAPPRITIVGSGDAAGHPHCGHVIRAPGGRRRPTLGKRDALVDDTAHPWSGPGGRAGRRSAGARCVQRLGVLDSRRRRCRAGGHTACPGGRRVRQARLRPARGPGRRLDADLRVEALLVRRVHRGRQGPRGCHAQGRGRQRARRAGAGGGEAARRRLPRLDPARQRADDGGLPRARGERSARRGKLNRETVAGVNSIGSTLVAQAAGNLGLTITPVVPTTAQLAAG